MCEEDFKIAKNLGVDGIWLSNHGGRKLDSTISALELLDKLNVKKNIPIILDGGFRSGNDVIKGIALGADFIAIGRPTLYGLSLNGKNGVSKVLDIIKKELKTSMAFCGVTDIKKINRNILF